MSLSVWLTRVFRPRQKPGTGCPGIWWSHRPWRSLRRDWMWHSVPRSGCHGGAGSQLGLRTSEGFSKRIDSVIRRGKGWCRARSGHGSSQSSHGPGPGRELPPVPAGRAVPRGPWPPGCQDSGSDGSCCSGWIPGRCQPLPSPSPRSPGSAVRRRLSAAASSRGGGRSRRLRGRKVSWDGKGREGNGAGSPPFLRCPSPGGPRWAAELALREGAAARAACAGPGWGCAPRGLASQALGL